MLAFNTLLLTVFIPHGHCYLWKPDLVGLYVISDALTALAYYSVSASLLYFVRKRQDLPFSWAFLLFATFIIACGTTHIVEIWTLWHPIYWVSGVLKAITAIASIATALLLLPLIPKALTLPSPAQLETANRKLQSEIIERQRLEKERDSFFKLSPDLLCIATFDDHFQYVNPACESETGFTAEELHANPYVNLIYPDDRAALIADACEVMTGIETTSFESRIQCKDGSIQWNVVMGIYHSQIKDRVWLLVNAEPQLDEAGNIRQVICTFSDDISERQAALRERDAVEERLKQQHELLQTIMDHVPVMLAFIDQQGQVQWVNQAWEKILGWSAQELHHPAWLTKLYPDPVYRRFVTDFIRNPIGKWHDFRTQTRNGDFIEAAWANVQLSDGSTIAIGQDITDRKLMEESLQQRTEREQLLVSITEHIRQSLDLEDILNTAVAEVRQLLQSDRVVIYRFNPDWSGNIVAESVCLDELSILGRLIHDPCFETAWQEIYRNGRISTIENVHADDVAPCYRQLLNRINVQANLVVPILHETTLWGLLVVHHCFAPHAWQLWEIDSLRQLATPLAIALQQSQLYRQVQQFNARLEQQVEERTKQLQRTFDFEALLKRITDNVRDSLEEAQILQTAVQELVIGLQVYSCDAALYDLNQNTSTILYEAVRCEVPAVQGTIIQISENLEVYNSLLQGHTLQLSWMPQYPNPIRPVAKRLTSLACPLMDNQFVIGDLWLYKAGEQCFEDLEIRLVQQVANQCAIAVRQARLYQAAQMQVQELERLNHLKDDFLSTVSHELRTPMSAIKMATQMLNVILTPLGVLDPVSGSAGHYFQILQDECQREISLINDLLDLSRLESGVEPLAIAPVDLRLWLPHILEPFEERTNSLQQHLQLDIPEQLPFLETDLSYLERILTELLNNACKYTPSDEIILISVRATPERLQLSISNSGIEIPAGELPHLFEKFYRVPSHDPWKHGGTGLGLTLVERCIRQIQGTITVTSEQGWTTFTLMLPWNI